MEKQFGCPRNLAGVCWVSFLNPEYGNSGEGDNDVGRVERSETRNRSLPPEMAPAQNRGG